jgi:DNA polymerase phi
MFDKQDDDDEEMPDADEDSDDDSDADSVEVIDADEAENDDSEEDEGEDEEELAAFDAKLAEALRTNGDNQDIDSDADMNDDEMEEVDEMLVKVFKARRQATTKKKDKKDAKETMTNFKNRVLDLLQVYIKKCYSSMLALDLILPLLQLTRRSTVDQISQKAGNVLAEYTSLCKRNAIPTLSKSDDGDEEHDPVEAVWELLRSVHKEATIQHRQKHSASVSQASLLLVRVLVAQDRQNIAQVIDIYAETQKTQMLSKNGHFKSGFFADWNAWCVNFGKNSKR